MTTSDFITVSAVETSSPRLMPATLGFYYAARLAISYLFFQHDPQLGAEVSLLLNLAFFLVVAFYVFGEPKQPLPLTAPLRWVLCFAGVALVSLTWSYTVSVPIALGYWSGMAADVVMVLLLMRSADADKNAESLLRGYVYGACFIACVTWLSPTMEDLRPGDDEFFSPNALAMTCAFGIFFSQYLLRHRKNWNLTTTFLAITMLRTLSKTTLIAFLIGQAFRLLRDRNISRKAVWAAVLSVVLVLSAFAPLLSSYYTIYTNAGNQAETLTGRVGIWGFVLVRAWEEPWLGHGFHGFRNVIPPFGTFEAWHAHNEIIQQFYTYGLVGLVMLFGLYISFYLHVRRSDQRSRVVLTSLLLFILVRGLADTERFDLSFPLWAIALLSSASGVAYEPRRQVLA